MSYGFSIQSTNGELLVHQEVRLPHYIGQATAIGAYAWATGPTIYPTAFTEFRITTAGPAPLPFIRPTGSDHRFAVVDVSSMGGNQWRIIVANVDGSGNRVVPQVHCFAQLAGGPSPGAYGVVVLDAAGNRAFDSNAKPLGISSVVTFAEAYSSGSYLQTVSVSGPSIPGVFGGAPGHGGDAGAISGKPTTWLPAYTWGFNGTMTFSAYGYRLTSDYGDTWRRVGHNALIVDLDPYL